MASYVFAKKCERYDLCEQLSWNTQGAVTQLCIAPPWDTSVTVRPLESNIPLCFSSSQLCPWRVHSRSVIWWYRALAAILACTVPSSYPSLATCSLPKPQWPLSPHVREAMLCAAGFKKKNQNTTAWWNGLYSTQTSSFFRITVWPHKQLGQRKQGKLGVLQRWGGSRGT